MCPHDKRGVLIPEVGLYTQVHLRNCPDYRGVLIYTFQRCPLKEVSPYCSLTYILHTMYIHTYIHVHTHAHPDPRLLLVAKWGGELTLSGRRQAEGLGASFQRCYYSQASGGSSQRDDLKVFASDEGRVQVTAASFTKVSASLHARTYVHTKKLCDPCLHGPQ